MDTLLWPCVVVGVLGLGFASYLVGFVQRQNAGSARMQEISQAIHEGAMAFLGREYRVLVLFAAAVAVILAVALQATGGWRTGLAFLAGAGCSALTGYIGM